MVVGEISEGAEVLVIGAGPAGYLAAIRAAQLGKDVTLVEKRENLGGVCLNDGCIPSKALIHASELFHEAGHSEDIGVHASPDLDVDSLQEWREEVVDKLTSGVEMLEERFGVEVVTGEARFESDGKVKISGEESTTVEFEDCIIATGSSVIEVPGIEIDRETVITSKEALQLDEVPERFVVIGGGYIGMELGTVYHKFGSEVTVLEAGDRILQGFPQELVEPVKKRAEELGMDIVTGTAADEVSVAEGTATVTAGGEEFEAEKVLVSVGRTPNTEGLGLDQTGVQTDEKGFIATDEQLETDTGGIYAIGDVTGEPMLAHKGYQDGKVAAEAVAGEESAAEFEVPAVVYTDPEIATVGMTEKEAEEQGLDIMTGKFSFSASGRAATLNDQDGFVKVVAEEDSEALLGVQIVGPNASEMIPEATLAIEMGALVPDISMTVHPHPTLSEAFKEAVEDAVGEAIHKYNPGRER
ncbi:MAG: dihydrolipoyl dehydrogenase [Candidatus Nanohaloarchaeota archaeon QJJ-7]|nr:dihydrolipoyl dehydrogenase [Candidatus Nanohaloarchaeota archaeon QJJ-7]